MNHVIILAAGKGTRMNSELHKVLHPVKGVSIIKRLLKNVEPICETPTLIVGYKAQDVIQDTDNKYHYIHQTEQLGTGHAIMIAADELKDRKDIETIIVLPGDHPLVSTQTLNNLIKLHADAQAAVTMATAIVENFQDENSVFLNYGRVIRGEDGLVDRIVEYKDANEEERAAQEVNLSYYCFDAAWLWENLKKIENNNASKEYYLTDIIKIAKNDNKSVVAYPIEHIIEAYGINTPEQLKMVEDTLGGEA